MKVVIVGDGKVGFTLADQLAKEGHDVVVIDKNKAVLNQLSEQLDVMVIPGNGASLTVQREAGVGESDVLIAATSADEINLLCCILGRKLGCKHTIARVRNPEYAEHMYFLKDELGLSMTINPELAAAREIFRLLRFPSFLKRESFAKGRVEIVEIEAAQVPRTLQDVDFAVCNGNYALDAGITDQLLDSEANDSEGATAYANVLAVRAGDETRPEIQALVAALTSEEVRSYIEETYGANVVPVF